MPISPLPTPPSSTDPANFDARADAFLGALPAFQVQANALEANVTALEASTTQAVSDAMAAGLANAAANAAATAADRVQTGLDRTATAVDAQRAEDAAAAAEAIVGFPAPMPGDIGKFLGFDGDEMVWLPAGVRMVTEYLTSGTSWTAPANLVGGRVQYRMVGGGASGGVFTPGISGAPGGYVAGTANVTPGSTYAYSIGAGGAAVGAGGVSSSNAGGATAMFGASAGGGPSSAGNAMVSPTPVNSGGDMRVSPYLMRIEGAFSSIHLSVVGPTPFGVTGVRNASLMVPASGYGTGGAGGNASAASEAGRPGLIELTYLVSI